MKGVNYHRPLFKFKQIIKKPSKTGKIAQSCNLPEVTRLILVASGTISRGGKGRSLAKDDLTPETIKLSKNEN